MEPVRAFVNLRGAAGKTSSTGLLAIRRFTRLTNAFSKKVQTRYFALAIYFMHYNYVRIHQTLRVMAGLKIALKEDKTKEKPRRPYTDAQAAKLLKAARKRTDALRRLTWLMAYTGARINELAQLRKDDVKAKSGIPFIGITSSDEKGQEMKTSSSRREVPSHKAVVAEGFLKWVEKHPEGWLFSDLPAGRYGSAVMPPRSATGDGNEARWALRIGARWLTRGGTGSRTSSERSRSPMKWPIVFWGTLGAARGYLR